MPQERVTSLTQSCATAAAKRRWLPGMLMVAVVYGDSSAGQRLDYAEKRQIVRQVRKRALGRGCGCVHAVFAATPI